MNFISSPRQMGKQKFIDDVDVLIKKPQLTLEEEERTIEEIVKQANDCGIPILPWQIRNILNAYKKPEKTELEKLATILSNREERQKKG